ncbi:glycosyltransferase [Thermoleptolyngbya sp. M55_K2018_002]|uniref:glycosyltransferase n=1 Tax=Thermoleptolyngbya sp. M55_K2018_002 TaxID=2747808 RepID=UPI0019DFAA62|nr:glycosyltransferase [Thermoleptolyngbya sp. M55_K2018_002]HIK39326.1 glycosyltransferase [Thermoleptolyngbya sp. M55_K2018_002]
MKIAILTSGFLPVVDGVTVTLLHRLKRLSELGHQVLVFCPSYESLESIYPNWADYTGHFLPGVEVINLPSASFMGVEFERNFTSKSYDFVLQRLAQFQPDVIHVDEPDRLFLGFGKIPAIAHAKTHQIPCTSFYHTNFLEYIDDFFPLPAPLQTLVRWLCQVFITQRVFNAYDVTLTGSKTTYEKLQKLGIRNALYEELLGVDLTAFSPTLRQELFFEKTYGIEVGDRTKLLFLGRLTPDKGWKFTLKAVPTLVQNLGSNRISLLIAGDGELRDTIRQSLTGVVDFHLLGRVSPNQIPALMANSDFHVTTSKKETKGLTLFEAFAAGIPAVAPAAGGVLDSIQPGVNGLLYEPDSTADFVEKLQLLIEDPDLRRRLGQQAREWVLPYGWDQAVDRLVSIWASRLPVATNP